MKKVLIVIIGLLTVFVSVFAVDFNIIPTDDVNEENVKETIKYVGCAYNSDNCKVWDRYNQKANNGDLTLGEKFASGVFTWDDIMDYIVYLVRFLSELGLLAGGLMIIYGGYQFLTTALGGDPGKGKNSVKYAIIGVIVLTFSYAIMRVVTEMFIR